MLLSPSSAAYKRQDTRTQNKMLDQLLQSKCASLENGNAAISQVVMNFCSLAKLKL